MKRKRPYKTVQVGFNKESDYKKFHNAAEKYYGTGRAADCEYIRACVKASTKKTMTRKKAVVLVEITEKINNLLINTDNPYLQDELTYILTEGAKLWEY